MCTNRCVFLCYVLFYVQMVILFIFSEIKIVCTDRIVHCILNRCDARVASYEFLMRGESLFHKQTHRSYNRL